MNLLALGVKPFESLLIVAKIVRSLSVSRLRARSKSSFYFTKSSNLPGEHAEVLIVLPQVMNSFDQVPLREADLKLLSDQITSSPPGFLLLSREHVNNHSS